MDRVLPLIEPAKLVLQKYIKQIRSEIMSRKQTGKRKNIQDNVLFPSYQSKGKMYNDTLENFFKKAVQNSGIKKKLTFHCLRYSFATTLLKNGMSIRYVQKLLGHRSIDTTGRYTKVLTDDLKSILETFHPRMQKPEKFKTEAKVKIYAD